MVVPQVPSFAIVISFSVNASYGRQTNAQLRQLQAHLEQFFARNSPHYINIIVIL